MVKYLRNRNAQLKKQIMKFPDKDSSYLGKVDLQDMLRPHKKSESYSKIAGFHRGGGMHQQKKRLKKNQHSVKIGPDIDEGLKL